VTRSNLLAVVLWMGGALVSFSAVAVSVRELAGHFSVFEMLALRNAAGLAILLALALLRPASSVSLAPRRMGLHLFRNGAHFLGQAAWTFGVTLLPLATVFAIEFTTPVWVALLAVVLLGERMSAPRLAAIVLGFLGVLVVVRPNPSSLDPAALIVLGSALAFALTSVATKELTRTETTFTILFWMNAMQFPLNMIGSDPWFLLRLADAPPLAVAGIALSGLAAHFCLTNAYHHGDATVVVPLDFLRIPLIALVGFWLYGEPLDPWVFAGAALIVGGIVWNLRAEAGNGKPAPAAGKA
jgi:drug/metabolite transporter (DMT)-like permease